MDALRTRIRDLEEDVTRHAPPNQNPNIVELIYGKNATVADLQRPLEDWEVNKHCLRSLKGPFKKT